MVVIEVGPVMINRSGSTYGFCSAPGTPSFNLVKNILQKYLGKNINVNYNYNEFTFVIENDEEDEGCETDTLDNFIKIIKSICEFIPDTYCDGRYTEYQLQFHIL